MVARKSKESVARKASVDGGNGSTKMMFEGVEQGLAIPTANQKVLKRSISRGAFLNSTKVTSENIQDHLDITFVSSKALEKTNERYYIGKRCLRDLDSIPDETEKEAKKHVSEIVARTALAGLLVDAIRLNPDSKQITAHYDLTLALPINSVDQEAFQQHASRFIGTHEMIFHYPNGEEVNVTIVIEFAMTLPEGAISAYSIIYDLQGDYKTYSITVGDEKKEITLEESDLILVDIGAGTLDIAVMNGLNFDFDNSVSDNLGTRKTIDKIRNEWNVENKDKLDSLLKFNEVYNDSSDENSARLQEFSLEFLDADSRKIATMIHEVYRKLHSRARIFVQGGGQLLYKRSLMPLFTDLDYISNVHFTQNPVFTNAEGLLIFALSPDYSEIKKEYLEALSV